MARPSPNSFEMGVAPCMDTVAVNYQMTASDEMAAWVLQQFVNAEFAVQSLRSLKSAIVPDALFIVVSNPVELAAQTLCEKLDRKRVVGIGRATGFAAVCKSDCEGPGVSRREVRATVLGERGLGMVPIWSSVELTTRKREMDAALEVLREESEG